MKKYKLIKEYPNNNNIGLIVWNNNDQYSWKEEGPYGSRIFSKSTVENFPEFWEEIIEPKYLITAFRSIEHVFECGIVKINPNGTFFSMIKLEDMLKGHNSVEDGCWEIYSVKNKDGVKFSLNEPVKTAKDVFTIAKFEINGNDIIVRFKETTEHDGLELIEKYILPKPVFTSADGKEMFVGDTYYVPQVNGMNNTLIGTVLPFYVTIGVLATEYKFSTKELAQEYIDNNKPKYSLKDIKTCHPYPNDSPLFESLMANLKKLGK